MRIGLLLSFFLITVLVYSQDLAVEVQDSLPAVTSLGTAVQDSPITPVPPAEKKMDSLILSDKLPPCCCIYHIDFHDVFRRLKNQF